MILGCYVFQLKFAAIHGDVELAQTALSSPSVDVNAITPTVFPAVRQSSQQAFPFGSMDNPKFRFSAEDQGFWQTYGSTALSALAAKPRAPKDLVPSAFSFGVDED